jgi:hypothetical protein
MIKSYLAKTTINFVDFEFYIRPGDLLVHDVANQNRLTVYRNGQIVKVVKQTSIGIDAFLKNKFIEPIKAEVLPAVVAAPEPLPIPEKPPVRTAEPKKAAPVVKPEVKSELEPSKVEKIEADEPLVKTI